MFIFCFCLRREARAEVLCKKVTVFMDFLVFNILE